MTYSRIPLEWRWGLAVGSVLLAVFAWLFAPVVSPRRALVSPRPHALSPAMVTITVRGILPEEALLVAGQVPWVAPGRPPIFFSSLNRVYYFKDAAMQQDSGEVVLDPAWWWTPNQLPITGRAFTLTVPANIARLAHTLR